HSATALDDFERVLIRHEPGRACGKTMAHGIELIAATLGSFGNKLVLVVVVQRLPLNGEERIARGHASSHAGRRLHAGSRLRTIGSQRSPVPASPHAG